MRLRRHKSPWIAFYFEDWAAGVAELSMEERGFYLTLLCHQWSHGSIPEVSSRQFLGSFQVTRKQLERLWPSVSKNFVTDAETGRLYNPRARASAEERAEKREKCIESIRKRWQHTNEHTNVSTNEPSNGDTKADSTTSTSTVSAEADKEEPAGKPPLSLSPEKPAPKKRASSGQRSAPVEDCRAYAVQLGLPASDGDAFHAKKEANNWTANGKPMHDWRKTMVSWKAEGYMASQKAGPNGQRPVPKYSSETGEKERALKEREKQLRENLPNDAQAEAMREALAKLAEKFPTQRT